MLEYKTKWKRVAPKIALVSFPDRWLGSGYGTALKESSSKFIYIKHTSESACRAPGERMSTLNRMSKSRLSPYPASFAASRSTFSSVGLSEKAV